MLKKFSILTIIIIVLASNSYSDDTIIMHSGGTIKMMDKEATKIQMTREIVAVYLYRDFYILDAIFEFHNHGEEIEVLVGFPDIIGGWLNHEGVINSRIEQFQTWFNGKELSFAEIKTHQGPGQPGYKYDKRIIIAGWFIKKVLFPSNTSSKTRVRYKASYSTFGLSPAFVYLYGTGCAWKGNIKEARFIVKASPSIWIFWSSFVPGHRQPEIHRLSEYEHEYVLRDFEPSKDETWEMLLSDRNQPWGYEDVPCIFTEKIVPDTFLHTLSLKQLRLFRNTFFALHGRIFQSKDLNAYFRQQWWYKQNENHRSDDLTETELANVVKILKYEEDLKKVLNK